MDRMVTFCSLGADNKKVVPALRLIPGRSTASPPSTVDSPSRPSTPEDGQGRWGQTLSHPECLLPGQPPQGRLTWAR